MDKKRRYWEIDLLRGLALVSMIIYHLAFDLSYFFNFEYSYFEPALFYLGKATAFTFLFLVGFSFSFSTLRHLFLRVFKIYLSASLVTLITYLVSPDLTVRFGILHLIAVSLLLLFPCILVKKRLLLLPVALVIISFGLFYSLPSSTISFDYYPIAPWFGFVLLGFVAAQSYLRHRPPLFSKDQPSMTYPLTYMGRHSLLIYLLHQPVLLLILLLFR